MYLLQPYVVYSGLTRIRSVKGKHIYLIKIFYPASCACQVYLHRNHVYVYYPDLSFCSACCRLPVWVAKRMEAMRAVYLASRSNTTRWHTVDLSRKARRLYKVSTNGQNKLNI